jgi:hypothetical protein
VDIIGYAGVYLHLAENVREYFQSPLFRERRQHTDISPGSHERCESR